MTQETIENRVDESKQTTPTVARGDRPGWEPPAKVTLRPPTPPAAVVPQIATDLEPARIIALADDLECWAAQIRTATAPPKELPYETLMAGYAFKDAFNDAETDLVSNKYGEESFACFTSVLDSIAYLADGNSRPEIRAAVIGMQMISEGWNLIKRFKDHVEGQ